VQLATRQDKLQQEELIQPALNALVAYDELKLNALLLTSEVGRYYKAILPDASEREFTLPVYLFRLMKDGIYRTMRPTGFKEILGRATTLVRESLDVQPPRGGFDLRDIDLSALNSSLHSGQRHIKAEQLRQLLYERIQPLDQSKPESCQAYGEARTSH
jgi:hypothetical protein